MPELRSCVRGSVFMVVVICAACAPRGDPAGSGFAEERAPSPPISTAAAPRVDGDESMAALTAEVRQLRIAVEQLARSQTETQALSVYLSAQQGRVAQARQRYDTVRRETEGAATQREDMQAELARLTAELPRANSPAHRADIETSIRLFQVEANGADNQLQQARAREDEASRALAREEDRWSDLLARMEQLTQ
jgi:chromosome segregation ATPase